MNSKTKESILALEIFEPSSQTGYGINAMLLNSGELLEIPKSELVAALTEMELDGLITHEEEYYRSTKQGKIARQKLITQQGMATEAITNQRQYALEDLILAIAANDKIEFNFQTGIVQKAAIEVYLHEFKEAEINIALEFLINSGHIQDFEFYPRDSIHITGDGLQYYQMEVRVRLNLNRGEEILMISLPSESDSRFSRLGLDPSFTVNLQNRWMEMNICANNGAYLASIILLGSILEGLLLARLHRDIKIAMTSARAPRDGKSGSTKTLTDWTLQDYIAVSVDIGFVPKSVEKHIHELRDTRNLVHPNKQITSNITADEPLYRISREVAETIIDALVSP